MTAADKINLLLEDIERTHNVLILLAVESGSRAWQFESPDSDYDVRFIYIRRVGDYLALQQPRDVIELPLVDDLYDINGWDLGKALNLAANGNSVLHEWLDSPTRYIDRRNYNAAIEQVAKLWRSAYTDVYHYSRMLLRQRDSYLTNRTEVTLKRYFYVMRPALTLQWLKERTDPPPMRFPALVDGLEIPRHVRDALTTLTQRKKHAPEKLGLGPRIPALDDYIEEYVQWGKEHAGKKPEPDPVLLRKNDNLFQSAVLGTLR
jgi:predicted nucleotidyltransferase